jgi:hypothetical protein
MTLLQFRLSAFCQCHIPQHHYLISLQFIAYTWIYFWLYYNYLLSYIWIYLNCNGSIGTVACIVATIRLYSTYYPVHTLLTDRYVPLLLPLSDTFCTPIYSIVLGLFGRALTFSTSKHSAGLTFCFRQFGQLESFSKLFFSTFDDHRSRPVRINMYVRSTCI